MLKFSTRDKIFLKKWICRGIVFVISTIFVAWIGQRIAFEYQIKYWKNQTDFELFKENYNGGMTLINDMSDLIGERYFDLMRIYWVSKEKDLNGLNDIWKDYYNVVIRWNMRISGLRMQLERFTSDSSLIEQFYSDEDSFNALYKDVTPHTLHGCFLKSHDLAKELRSCLKGNNCSDQNYELLIKNFDVSLDELRRQIQGFYVNAVAGVTTKSRNYSIYK